MDEQFKQAPVHFTIAQVRYSPVFKVQSAHPMGTVIKAYMPEGGMGPFWINNADAPQSVWSA